MLSTEPASAVIARIPVPPGIQRLRARWDRAASMGVPAHVTVLFPFLPPGELTPVVRHELASIAAAHAPFDVAFESVGRFPTVVYLMPEPGGPFAALTRAVHAQFPDFPPYEGVFDEVVPHLTVVESATAPLDEIALDAARHLPIRHEVGALEVLVEGSEGRWHPRWRIPLGRLRR